MLACASTGQVNNNAARIIVFVEHLQSVNTLQVNSISQSSLTASGIPLSAKGQCQLAGWLAALHHCVTAANALQSHCCFYDNLLLWECHQCKFLSNTCYSHCGDDNGLVSFDSIFVPWLLHKIVESEKIAECLCRSPERSSLSHNSRACIAAIKVTYVPPR